MDRPVKLYQILLLWGALVLVVVAMSARFQKLEGEGMGLGGVRFQLNEEFTTIPMRFKGIDGEDDIIMEFVVKAQDQSNLVR